MTDAPEVTLAQLLDSREARAAFQRTLLAGYGWPLVSLTVNMPGPCKRGPKADAIFEVGVFSLRQRLAGAIRYSKLRALPTGQEGFFVVELEARALKDITCRLEDGHPLGRLMDMDVIDTNGQIIGRNSIGLPPRGCLVCGAPGPGCARSRAHSLEALHAAIDSLLAAWACGPDKEGTALG